MVCGGENLIGGDGDGGPWGVEGAGDGAGAPDKGGGKWARADGDEEAIAGAPSGTLAVLRLEFLEIHADSFCGITEGELTEGGEVTFLEKIPSGGLGTLTEVNFAFFEAAVEVAGREVDELDLIGAIEETIGDGFSDGRVGDSGYDV